MEAPSSNPRLSRSGPEVLGDVLAFLQKPVDTSVLLQIAKQSRVAPIGTTLRGKKSTLL